MKPATIRRFDVFYLAWVALTVVDFFLRKDAYIAKAAAASSQQSGSGGAVLGSTFVTVVFALWVLFLVLMWFLVSIKRSIVAKWIIVVLALIGLFGIPALFNQGLNSATILGVLMILASLGASISLFGAEANGWFGRPPVAEPATED